MPRQSLDDLENAIHYRFRDRLILDKAMRHSSATTDPLSNNQRMEFLGDAVMALIVANHLFRVYSTSREGELTRIKSFVVSTATLDRRAQMLFLADYSELGGGMITAGSGGEALLPPSVNANLFEALIAAIYLDGGWGAAETFVLDHLLPEIEHLHEQGHDHNFKSILQQVSQREFGCTPRYRVLKQSGPDHDKRFEIQVQLGARKFTAGAGNSKKEAEQRAAEIALKEMSESPAAPAGTAAVVKEAEESEAAAQDAATEADVEFTPDLFIGGNMEEKREEAKPPEDGAE
jgi:ribonuclease III